MQHTHYSVKICTHDKIISLKSLQNYVRDFPQNRKFKDFQAPYLKCTVFQGFQGLKKAVVIFKYFQTLQGPVPTLLYINTSYKNRQ